jgi:hypothetical protein
MASDIPATLITVTLPPGATLQDVLRQFDLTPEQVDHEYGLVAVNPAEGTFALLVTEEAAARITGTSGARGPYADPRIEPYGPPQRRPGDSVEQEE